MGGGAIGDTWDRARASFEGGGGLRGEGGGGVWPAPPPPVFAHQNVSQQVFFLLVLGFCCKNR